MNSPRISVVVPMYKTSRYLEECVRSITTQSLRDIEVLLVDDGSPDDCGDKAEQFAKQDARIRVIHRENGGLGAARNSGIEEARGEYIAFIDSDDWIDPGMLSTMYQAANASNADACLSGMKVVANGSVAEVYENPFAGKRITGEAIFDIRKSFYGSSPVEKAPPVNPSACCILYHNSLFKDGKLRFSAMKSEDALFNIEAFRQVNTAVCLCGSPYCYRKEGQPSITNSFSESMIQAFGERYKVQMMLAMQENEKWIPDCIVRTKKWGLDIARILVSRVAIMVEPAQRARMVRTVCSSEFVCDSLRDFPQERLPVGQRAFFWALSLKMPHVLLALVKLRGPLGR